MTDEQLDVLGREVAKLRAELDTMRWDRDRVSSRRDDLVAEVMELRKVLAKAAALLPEWRQQYKPSAWRHEYAERIADATACACADDLEKALKG